MIAIICNDIGAFLSSDAFDHVTSALSNVITIGVAMSGYRLARNWLTQRNSERAHDAASDFFDELINLPPALLRFMMDSSRCAAFMCTIDDDTSLQHYNSEVQQWCLCLAEDALMIKLRFFGYFAKTDKRGVSVRQEGHKAIERALIQFGDTSFVRFNNISVQLIMVKNYDDYEQILRSYNRQMMPEIHHLIQNVNSAITPLIDISFRDYFSFPDSAETGRGQQ